MSDTNTPSGPLSINLSTTAARTSVPQPKPGELTFWRLTSYSVILTEKGQIGKFKWELSRPTVSMDGHPLNPGDFGSVHIQSVFYYAAPDKDQLHFLKTLAKIQDALLGTGDENNAKGKPARPQLITPDSTLGNINFDGNVLSMMLGKEMATKMKVNSRNADEVEFGQQLIYPGDVKA